MNIMNTDKKNIISAIAAASIVIGTVVGGFQLDRYINSTPEVDVFSQAIRLRRNVHHGLIGMNHTELAYLQKTDYDPARLDLFYSGADQESYRILFSIPSDNGPRGEIVPISMKIEGLGKCDDEASCSAYRHLAYERLEKAKKDLEFDSRIDAAYADLRRKNTQQ